MARGTVAELLEHWILHITSQGRAPSTLERYRSSMKANIVPALGLWLSQADRGRLKRTMREDRRPVVRSCSTGSRIIGLLGEHRSADNRPGSSSTTYAFDRGLRHRFQEPRFCRKA
jgi:protein tyrosine phosphatase (PTP) superfamily phosphohydrolase (DUF442 family)